MTALPFEILAPPPSRVLLIPELKWNPVPQYWFGGA